MASDPTGFHRPGLRQVAGKLRVEPDSASDGRGTVLYHLEVDYAR
jgi:hypothetical protein